MKQDWTILKMGLCHLLLMIVVACINASIISREEVGSSFYGFHIADHTPDQVLSEGQKLTLSCRVKSDLIDGNDDWKTCRWTRISDGASCLFEYKKENGEWKIEEFCEKKLDDVVYFGSDPNLENHICGIDKMGATQDDSSDWKCTIEECKLPPLGGCSARNGNGNYVDATMNVKINPQP